MKKVVSVAIAAALGLSVTNTFAKEPIQPIEPAKDINAAMAELGK